MPPILPGSGLSRRPSLPALLGFGVVAAARALTLPESLWESDEIRFAQAIEKFDPIAHTPHPPGYPLLVGLGKLFALVFRDPFTSLVALAFVSTLVSYAALVVAFRRMLAGSGADPETEAMAGRVAVVGALLFHLSPAMMVQGALPMSDPPALMFLALALAAGAVLATNGSTVAAVALGACASAAIGCRPQLAIAILPMLAVALWQAPGWRNRARILGAFTVVSLLWLAPLLVATGGIEGFLQYQSKQAAYVAAQDAAASRNGWSPLGIALRFIAHPWGIQRMSLPLLVLAAVGSAWLAWRRRWRILPLVVLALVHIGFGLLVMDPADGVRYALPSVLGVAFLAAAGAGALTERLRVPALAYGAAFFVAIGTWMYAGPLLEARSTSLSPPARAALWAKRELPSRAIVLWEGDLVPHSLYLFRDFQRMPVTVGMGRLARESSAPVYLFTEGESSWPGTRVFRWPESDAYGKLTRNKYRVVSLAPFPRTRRYLSVRGLHPFEQTLRAAHWRWMKADAALLLFPPRGAREVAVTLGLAAEAPIPSNGVTVLVAGRPAASLEIPRGSRRRAVLPLPPAPTVEVAFRSRRSFVPADMGAGADTRRLAVQLLDVEQIAH
jgi:hypothetical protein